MKVFSRHFGITQMPLCVVLGRYFWFSLWVFSLFFAWSNILEHNYIHVLHSAVIDYLWTDPNVQLLKP
jgi:hypothetical protein